MISIQKTGQGQGGFMLLEALISILIFSVGVLSLVGLQSMATRYSTDAQFRSVAGYLADQKMGEIWVADRAALASLAGTEDVDDQLPSGTRTVAIAGDMASGYSVTVTVAWTLPGGSTHQHMAVTNIHDRCNTVGCS